MTTFAVGKDVLSYCGKCKLKLSHLIMAMNEKGGIAKCKCNTCGGVHAFREGPAKKRASTAGRRKKAEAIPLSVTWAEGLSKVEEMKPYSIRATFVVGDGITHPTFGDGFVDAIVDNSKISVVFKNDIKVLVHGK